MHKTKTLVKICGITSTEQAIQVAELGVNAIGIISVKESPRYISAEIKRCDLGEVSIFDNNLNCSDLTVGNNSDRVARAASKDLENFAKNAYDTNNSAITLFNNNDVPGDIGIGKYSKQQIHVRTCWDSSCPTQTNANTKNVDQCIIDVE